MKIDPTLSHDQKSRARDYDLVVIGGGPGGAAAAQLSALNGLRVCIINDGPVMGYGIEGAFKSKSLFEIARHRVYFSHRADVFGAPAKIDFNAIRDSVEKRSELLQGLCRKKDEVLGIDVVEGRGRFVDPHTIAVSDSRYRADRIVIATGTHPRVFPNIEVDGERILTSDHVSQLRGLPESMLILGSGVIGCEFSSIFSEFGSRITLIDTQPVILSHEDEDLSRFLTKAYGYFGIEVFGSCRCTEMKVEGGKVHTLLSDRRTVVTDTALLAVGRVPNSEDLNLELAGVEVDSRGYIPTTDVMKTNVPHIYAVGDIGYRNVPIDMCLVHVAEAEGRCAALSILSKNPSASMDHVPFIIFTIPMIAGAGLNEKTAAERYGGELRVGKYPYGRNHRAHAMHNPMGFVKLVVAPEGDDRVLGVRAIGRDSDSVAGIVSMMIENELPYTYFLSSIQPHPSLSECLQGAAQIIEGNKLRYQEGEEYLFFGE